MAAARTVPALAGILTNLPIVTTKVLLIVWHSQGEQVALGTLGPMTLGMLSPSAYAMLATVTFGFCGAPLGAAVSWVSAVMLCTAPTLVFLRRSGTKDIQLPPTVAHADHELGQLKSNDEVGDDTMELCQTI